MQDFKSIIFIFVFLCLSMPATAQSVPQHFFAPPFGTVLAEHMPKINLKSLSGQDVKPASNKPLIVNFWATWCAPCVVEMPMMIKLAKTTDSELVFVSIDKEKSDISTFLNKNDMSQSDAIFVHDETYELSQTFQTYYVPETYISDSKNVLRMKYVGGTDQWTSPEMVYYIETLK